MKRLFRSKRIFRYTAIAVTSTVFPKLLGVCLSFITQQVVEAWVSCLVFIGAFIVVCLAAELIDFFSKNAKKEKTSIAVEKIKSVGDKYKYVAPDGTLKSLFTINEDEEELAESLLNKKYRPVIYYSLTVKDYINWIDYCYFACLRDLKKELGCKIIVALHPDNSERAKIPGGDAQDAVSEWFQRVLKSVIGKVTIVREEDVYKKDPKSYAVDFHSLYVSLILKYAESHGGEFVNANKFNTYLGYVESVFSVRYYAEKYVRTRQLFVLDRKNSQEIWLSSEKLRNFKTQNHFIFVSSETLTDAAGKKLNVYDKAETACLTDDPAALSEKLAKCDYYTLSVMYKLLLGVIGKPSEFVPPEKEIRSRVEELFAICRRGITF